MENGTTPLRLGGRKTRPSYLCAGPKPALVNLAFVGGTVNTLGTFNINGGTVTMGYQAGAGGTELLTWTNTGWINFGADAVIQMHAKTGGGDVINATDFALGGTLRVAAYGEIAQNTAITLLNGNMNDTVFSAAYSGWEGNNLLSDAYDIALGADYVITKR